MIIMPNQKAKNIMHSLSVSFQPELTSKECFGYIFRVIPLQRFNGCFFYAADYRDEKAACYSVEIASRNKEGLEEIKEVLLKAPAFIEALANPKIHIKPFSFQNKVLATVAGNKVKTSGNSSPIVKDGAQWAADKPISSARNFKKQPCRKCGADTAGFGFCPSCHKQCRHLPLRSVLYLLVILGFSLVQSVRVLSSLPFAGPWIKILFALQLLILFAAILLLCLYRKAGFWLFVFNKIADVLLLFALQGRENTGFFALILLAWAVLIIILYSVLSPDMAHMK